MVLVYSVTPPSAPLMTHTHMVVTVVVSWSNGYGVTDMVLSSNGYGVTTLSAPLMTRRLPTTRT
jgi:hypothetical protein